MTFFYFLGYLVLFCTISFFVIKKLLASGVIKKSYGFGSMIWFVVRVVGIFIFFNFIGLGIYTYSPWLTEMWHTKPEQIVPEKMKILDNEFKTTYQKTESNLMQLELKNIQKKMDALAVNTGTSTLKPDEMIRMTELKNQFEATKKKYLPKTQVKVSEWDYVFGWDATDKQMEATNRKQIPSNTYKAKVFMLTDNKMAFVYQTNKTKENVSVRLKRRIEKIKGNQGLYYKGWIQNVDTGKSDPIWLIQTSTPNEFNGWIGEKFGAEAFLSKK